jgi:hypothetical protein
MGKEIYLNISEIRSYFDDKNLPFYIEDDVMLTLKKWNLPYTINHNTRRLTIKKLPKKFYAKVISSLIVFFIFGIPFTILSPRLTYKILYKYVNLDIFDYNIFIISKPIKRLFFLFYTLLMVLYVPYIIINIKTIYEERFELTENHYNWTKLYKSLIKNGYDPEKFSSFNNNVGFIKVAKNKNLGCKYPYMCVDGNHRLFLLKKIYKDKKIRVLID